MILCGYCTSGNVAGNLNRPYDTRQAVTCARNFKPKYRNRLTVDLEALGVKLPWIQTRTSRRRGSRLSTLSRRAMYGGLMSYAA